MGRKGDSVMSESVVTESDGREFAALSNPYILIIQKRLNNLFLVGKKKQLKYNLTPT
jgi:hypothetical protein